MGGKVVSQPGTKVGPDDEIRIDGKPLSKPRSLTLMLNKPAGYITTMDDPHARKTAMQLIPDVGTGLKPVGRLDKETEGLLLFTNEGELAHRLTHPRYEVEKEYEVEVEGIIGAEAAKKLESGMFIEGRRTAPAKVRALKTIPKRRISLFNLIVHEGRKRQIREMCARVGHPIRKLKRVRVGPLVMRDLPKGACRSLNSKELAALRKAVGLI